MWFILCVSLLIVTNSVSCFPLIKASKNKDFNRVQTNEISVYNGTTTTSLPENKESASTSTELAPAQRISVFEGLCVQKRDPIIYTENFILENDKKSQVMAAMQISMANNVLISCVEIISRSDDLERPRVSGWSNPEEGKPANSVEVSIKTSYGKGFNFTVKLYGVYT